VCRRAGPGFTLHHASADEVVDPAVRHELLELLQRGGGIGPVEASNGHDRQFGGKLVAGRVVGTHDGGGPSVACRVFCSAVWSVMVMHQQWPPLL
jgi:hypothetical protein